MVLGLFEETKDSAEWESTSQIADSCKKPFESTDKTLTLINQCGLLDKTRS